MAGANLFEAKLLHQYHLLSLNKLSRWDYFFATVA
jgi:hypothetical protein